MSFIIKRFENCNLFCPWHWAFFLYHYHLSYFLGFNFLKCKVGHPVNKRRIQFVKIFSCTANLFFFYLYEAVVDVKNIVCCSVVLVWQRSQQLLGEIADVLWSDANFFEVHLFHWHTFVPYSVCSKYHFSWLFVFKFSLIRPCGYTTLGLVQRMVNLFVF